MAGRRSIRRIAADGVMVIALIVAMLFATFWVRSYWWIDTAYRRIGTRPDFVDRSIRQVNFNSDRGTIMLIAFFGESDIQELDYVEVMEGPIHGKWSVTPMSSAWVKNSPLFKNGPGVWRLAGFGATYFSGQRETVISVEFPHWFGLLVASAIAFPRGRFRVRLWMRRHRRRAGLCRGCGYDRAGTAKGAKCPECGR